jgi:hypothetical protein
MGHFAQYRHRGGGSTGFTTGPAASGAWTFTNVTQHASINPTNPSLPGVIDAIAITYLIATPNVIIETIICAFGIPNSGVNTYGAGQVGGARIAYRTTGGVIVSPYSSEKTVTF